VHYAVYYNDSEILSLLARNGANVNIRDNHGDTPLIWAVITKNVVCTMLLLHHGADTTVKLKEGIRWDCLDNRFTVQVLECLEAIKLRDKVRRDELHKTRVWEIILPSVKQLNIEQLTALRRS